MSPEGNGWRKAVGRPSRHIGWVFAGPAELESRASTFLAEGFGCHERLVYVADDPNVHQWPKAHLDRGDLLVRSTSEVYGPDRLVDVASHRAMFDEELSQALCEGYTGLRVVGDSTSLIDGPLRLDAWLRWEDEAERLIAENPVTGLCAFDGTRADAEAVEAVISIHRATEPRVP